MPSNRIESGTNIINERISFSMPLVLSGILQQLYSWADAFIIGHAELHFMRCSYLPG